MAGILGPVIVNYIREYQLDHGVARANAYSVTMYILAGLLAVGFVCNWLVKPVDPSLHMKEDAAPVSPATASRVASDAVVDEPAINPAFIVLAWAAVWIPIGWGVWMTLEKAVVLFREP